MGMEGALLNLAKATGHTACCSGGMPQPGGKARSCWTPAGTVPPLTTRAAVLTGRARGLARAAPDVVQAGGSGLFPHHLQGPAQVGCGGDWLGRGADSCASRPRS
ncbi:hypothetical protein GCM10010279_69470 [Streptomyces mutabilis]|nr:hypothetical protein GCM10010279_69470 [Streptomyces mutabilis]